MDWSVGDDCGEVFALQNLFRARAQRVLELRRNAIQVLQQILHRPKFLDQLAGGLIPNPRDARDVVGGVAFQPLVVRQSSRVKAKPGLEFLSIIDGRLGDPPAGDHDFDVGVDQLEHIEITGDDEHVKPFGRGRARHGPQHVVGLVAVDLEDGDTKRLQDFLRGLNLGPQVIGHSLPGGLVFFELRVAEGGSGLVERGGDVTGLLLVEDLQQHIGEPVDGVGRPTLTGREVGQREKGPVDQAVGVDEDELAGTGGHNGT